MEEAEPKKTPIKWVVVGIVIGVIITASLILLYSTLSHIVNRPKPEIISTYEYDGFQGFNYVCYVEVTVKNNGGDGWIKVFAEISGAGKYEKQNQRIHLASGESQHLTFTFDISLWGALFNSLTYRAWAVAD